LDPGSDLTKWLVYSASDLPESWHTLQKGLAATLLEVTIFFWENEADIFDLIERK
jgi:hypothetical protein